MWKIFYGKYHFMLFVCGYIILFLFLLSTVAKKKMKLNPRQAISNGDFIEFTRNCSTFKQLRGYTEYPVSEQELQFPVAFSILFYKNLEQVENLLRTIYRPHNWYCLHLDADASTVNIINALLFFTNFFLQLFAAHQAYSSLQSEN